MSNFLEKQKIQIKISLKKINIDFKFPCCIRATLTVDNDSQNGSTHEVKNGQVLLNQIISMRVYVNFNRLKGFFEEKKIGISFYILSGNINKLVGEVKFSLLGKEYNRNYENIQYLQNCSQKNSKAYFSYIISIIRQEKQGKSNIVKSNNLVKPNKDIYSSLKMKQSPVHLKSNQQKKMATNSNVFNYNRNFQIKHPDTNQVEESYYFKSPEDPSKDIRLYKSQDKLASRQQQKLRNANSKQKQKKMMETTKITPNTLKAHKSLSNLITQRIKTRQAEGSPILQSHRSINNLQANKSIDKMQNLNGQSNNGKASSNENQLSGQLARNKQKLKIYEKNTRSIEKKLKKSLEENEKKLIKINHLQQIKIQQESIIKNKQVNLKKIEKKYSDLTNDHQQLTQLFKCQKMQFQQRQALLKEQVSKLEQKNKQCELHRERIMQQCNATLNQLQESEKKYQNALKQKDRHLNEEKVRLMKKIQRYSIQNIKYESEGIEIKAQLQQLIKQKRSLIERVSQLQILFNSQQLLTEELRKKLRIQQSIIDNYEDQIQGLKGEEGQKQRLKKKIIEINTNQLLSYEKINKFEKQIENLQLKINQLTFNINNLLNQKQSLQQKLLNQRRNVESLQIEQATKTKQIQILINIKNTLNIKMKQQKQKHEAEKKQFAQLLAQQQYKIDCYQRQFLELKSQIEDAHWELEKQKTSMEECSKRLKNQNDELIKYNEIIYEKQQKLKQIEEQQRLNQIQITQLRSNNIQLRVKYDEQLSKLKLLKQQMSDMKEEMRKLNEQIRLQREQYKSYEVLSKQKTAYLQNKSYDVSQQVKQKQRVIQQMKQKLQNLQQQNNFQHSKLSKVEIQLQKQNEILLLNKLQIEGLCLLKGKLKEKDQELMRSTQSIYQLEEKRRRQVQEVNKKFMKITNEYEQYKKNTNHSLSIFFSQIIKDNQLYIQSVFTSQFYKSNILYYAIYPNQDVANLMTQFIYKRNNSFENAKLQIQKLSKQKQRLQGQIANLKLKNEEITNDSSSQMMKMRQKKQKIEDDLFDEIQILKMKIIQLQNSLQKKSEEVEKMRYQQSERDILFSQLQSRLQMTIRRLLSLQLQKKDLQDLLVKYKTANSMSEQQVIQKINKNQQILEFQLQKLQSEVKEYQQKVAILSCKVFEKDERIKKYENQVNQLNFEVQKRQKRQRSQSQIMKQHQVSIRKYDLQVKQKERQYSSLLKRQEQMEQKMKQTKLEYIHLLQKYQLLANAENEMKIQLSRAKDECLNEQNKRKDIENKYKFKFQSQKIQNDKLSNEIKTLKQAIINKNSQIELKSFMIMQLEKSLKSEQESKRLIDMELEKRKSDIFFITQKLEKEKQKICDLEYSLSNLQSEKEEFIRDIKKYYNQILYYENHQQEKQILKLQIETLLAQVERLKRQRQQQQQFYERQINELKALMRETKKTQIQRLTRQQQLKLKVKLLQKTLEETCPDLALQKKKLRQQLQKEKKQQLLKIQKLYEQKLILQDQVCSLQLMMKKEGEVNSRVIKQLRDQISAKDLKIKNQVCEAENAQLQINQLLLDRLKYEKQTTRINKTNKSS